MALCPAAIAYPCRAAYGIVNAYWSSTPTVVGRNDYVANGGDRYTSPGVPGASWPSADSSEGGSANINVVEFPPGQMTSGAKTTFAGVAGAATGVVYVGSMVRMADVTDGTSNTYLAGEKYLTPDNYDNGEDTGDNEAALIGENEDISRWTFSEIVDPRGSPCPLQDTPGYIGRFIFGSAHANGFHMAFCDGSVQMINYTVDVEIHRCLGNRKDGLAIDGKRF